MKRIKEAEEERESVAKMSEARDPAIKLFGKTIPLPEFPLLLTSPGPPDPPSGTLLSEDAAADRAASSSNSSSPRQVNTNTHGEEKEVNNNTKVKPYFHFHFHPLFESLNELMF